VAYTLQDAMANVPGRSIGYRQGGKHAESHLVHLTAATAPSCTELVPMHSLAPNSLWGRQPWFYRDWAGDNALRGL
jgi:hypothetical protein